MAPGTTANTIRRQRSGRHQNIRTARNYDSRKHFPRDHTVILTQVDRIKMFAYLGSGGDYIMYEIASVSDELRLALMQNPPHVLTLTVSRTPERYTVRASLDSRVPDAKPTLKAHLRFSAGRIGCASGGITANTIAQQ